MGAASNEDFGKEERESEAEEGTEARAGVVGVGVVRSISGAGVALVVEEAGREGGETEGPVEKLVEEGRREALGSGGVGSGEVGRPLDS